MLFSLFCHYLFVAIVLSVMFLLVVDCSVYICDMFQALSVQQLGLVPSKVKQVYLHAAICLSQCIIPTISTP